MLTHETENYIIIHPNFKMLSAGAVREIQDYICDITSEKRVVIDMSAICSISMEFLQFLATYTEKLILLNCCAEVLVLLNLTNSDKNVQLFTNTIDLIENKRELRNRKFAIV